MISRKEYQQKWYFKNRVRLLEKAKRYRSENPALIKEWRLRNRSYLKRYRRRYFSEYCLRENYKEQRKISQLKWIKSNKGKIYSLKKSKEWYWKNRIECLKRAKEYRENNKGLIHNNNIKNRKYFREYRRQWKINNPEKYRQSSKAWAGLNRVKLNFKHKYYARKRKGLIGVIQRVYEDNIKQYGTLTCYLCLKSVGFGEDNLEHKMPISRGGDNEYANLAIAHKSCNCKKHNKTEEEYRKLLKEE